MWTSRSEYNEVYCIILRLLIAYKASHETGKIKREVSSYVFRQ